jgi:hypothetical protein
MKMKKTFAFVVGSITSNRYRKNGVIEFRWNRTMDSGCQFEKLIGLIKNIALDLFEENNIENIVVYSINLIDDYEITLK